MNMKFGRHKLALDSQKKLIQFSRTFVQSTTPVESYIWT